MLISSCSAWFPHAFLPFLTPPTPETPGFQQGLWKDRQGAQGLSHLPNNIPSPASRPRNPGSPGHRQPKKAPLQRPIDI